MPHVLRLFVFLAVAFLVLAQAANADTVPKFKDYPASVYTGRSAPVRLNTPEERNFRSRLSEAAKQPVNFAGHYTLVTWGCGNLCQTGAAINAKNGEVTFLPHTVCCWGEGETPFYYRANSRLLVLGGMLDEEEPRGAHFFEFDGSQFIRLKNSGVAGDETVASSTPNDDFASNSPDMNSKNTKSEPIWNEYETRPNVDNLIAKGYHDICNGKVERISLEQGHYDPPADMVPNVGADGEADWQAWTDMDVARGPFNITCYEKEAEGLSSKRELSSLETNCYFIDGIALCGGGGSVEPAAGEEVSDAMQRTRLTELWEKTGRVPSYFLMACYMITGEQYTSRLTSIKDDQQYEAAMIAYGGLRRIAEESIRECNKASRDIGFFLNEDASYARAEAAFREVAIKGDEQFLINCKLSVCEKIRIEHATE